MKYFPDTWIPFPDGLFIISDIFSFDKRLALIAESFKCVIIIGKVKLSLCFF
jgi:hypothetical protein